MSMYNKYLKYKKKYLDLCALKTQMKGGADGDDGDYLEPGLLQQELLQEPDLESDLPQVALEIDHIIISYMSDAKKINIAYKFPQLDLGIQYLYDPITHEQAFKVRVRDWRIVDKFIVTNILVNNLDELNAFSAHRNHIYIKYLKFGDYFNQSLGTSLNELKNLQVLKFGFEFDKDLGTSLNELKNLQVLEFGYRFNKELGTSLNELENLQVLEFGDKFDKNLGTSLNNLKNLQVLKFGDKFGGQFDQELGTSLDKLENLKVLEFGYEFNRPLGTSLNKLKNLKELKLGSRYNKDLGTSLYDLKNLEILDLGYILVFKILEYILNLPNLKKLIFRNEIIYPYYLKLNADEDED